MEFDKLLGSFFVECLISNSLSACNGTTQAESLRNDLHAFLRATKAQTATDLSEQTFQKEVVEKNAMDIFIINGFCVSLAGDEIST
jgi:ATP-dependent exoDNAse (exonuclease V) beta subunit